MPLQNLNLAMQYAVMTTYAVPVSSRSQAGAAVHLTKFNTNKLAVEGRPCFCLAPIKWCLQLNHQCYVKGLRLDCRNMFYKLVLTLSNIKHVNLLGSL